MPHSTDIELPIEQKPIFPGRCVRCGQEHDDHTIRLWTHKVSWWTLLTFAGKPMSVRVPACRPCSWLIRFQRVGGVICMLAIAWLVMWLVYPWIKLNVAAPFKNYVAMALIMIALLPWFYWEIAFPPCIDITAIGDSITYEFRSEDYADEFLFLNFDHEEDVSNLRKILPDEYYAPP